MDTALVASDLRQLDALLDELFSLREKFLLLCLMPLDLFLEDVGYRLVS